MKVLMAVMVVCFSALTAPGQGWTFSRDGVEYVIEFPSATWRVVSRLDVHEHPEFVYGTDELNGYLRLSRILVDSDGLMWRNLVSVDWIGNLYDCDFNQMLDLPVAPELPQTVAEFNPQKFAGRRILTGSHCFGCTAGAGSSCGGAVATE